MAKLRPCDRVIARGRLRKAVQLWEAADLVLEFADDEADVGGAYVTLAVHAGIGASDAVLAKPLSALLAIKTNAGYGHRPVNAGDRGRTRRRAEKLVTAARERLAGG